MPKFHSKEHEANWRAAMAKRSKTKPKTEANGALDEMLKELRAERDKAHEQLAGYDCAIKALITLRDKRAAA